MSEAKFSVEGQYANEVPAYFIQIMKAVSLADIHYTEFLWEMPHLLPLSAYCSFYLGTDCMWRPVWSHFVSLTDIPFLLKKRIGMELKGNRILFALDCLVL